MVRKWAARADVVLLNQKELAAELEALKQAHLTLQGRGAGGRGSGFYSTYYMCSVCDGRILLRILAKKQTCNIRTPIRVPTSIWRGTQQV